MNVPSGAGYTRIGGGLILAIGVAGLLGRAAAEGPREDQRKVVRTKKGIEYRGVVRAYGQRYIKVVTPEGTHRVARADLDGNPKPVIEAPGFDTIGADQAMAKAESERLHGRRRPAMVHYRCAMLLDPSRKAPWGLWQYSASAKQIELCPRIAIRATNAAFGKAVGAAVNKVAPSIRILWMDRPAKSPSESNAGNAGAGADDDDAAGKGYEYGLLVQFRKTEDRDPKRAVAGRLKLLSLPSKRKLWVSKLHPVDMTLDEIRLTDAEKEKLWVTAKDAGELATKLAAGLGEYLKLYEVTGQVGFFNEREHRKLVFELKDLLRRRGPKGGARGTRDHRLVESLLVAWMVPSLSDRALTQAIEISPVITRRVLVGWVCMPDLPKHLGVPTLQCLTSCPEDQWEDVVADPKIDKIMEAIAERSHGARAKLLALRELLAPLMVTEAVSSRARPTRRAAQAGSERPGGETAAPGRQTQQERPATGGGKTETTSGPF